LSDNRCQRPKNPLPRHASLKLASRATRALLAALDSGFRRNDVFLQIDRLQSQKKGFLRGNNLITDSAYLA
jgi:hypothetical protein